MNPNKKNVDSEAIQLFDNLEQSSPEKNYNVLPITPKNIIKTKDKVSEFLVKDSINKGEIYLKIENAQSKKPITTKVTFSYEGFDIVAKQEFTPFDREVHDSIVSLYLAGNEYFTPNMIYRTMTGKNKSEYVSPKKLKEITSSVDKCMYSKLLIDATQEMDIYKSFTKMSATLSGNLIHAIKMSVKMYGQEVSAYKLLTAPILYRYASQKNQIASIPIELLNTPLIKTTEVIILQGYLLRRIETIKNPKNKVSSSILYDTIYKFLGQYTASKQKKEKIRKDTKKILSFWVEKKYISGYEETTKGKTKYSILIST